MSKLLASLLLALAAITGAMGQSTTAEPAESEQTRIDRVESERGRKIAQKTEVLRILKARLRSQPNNANLISATLYTEFQIHVANADGEVELAKIFNRSSRDAMEIAADLGKPLPPSRLPAKVDNLAAIEKEISEIIQRLRQLAPADEDSIKEAEAKLEDVHKERMEIEAEIKQEEKLRLERQQKSVEARVIAERLQLESLTHQSAAVSEETKAIVKQGQIGRVAEDQRISDALNRLPRKGVPVRQASVQTGQ